MLGPIKDEKDPELDELQAMLEQVTASVRSSVLESQSGGQVHGQQSLGKIPIESPEKLASAPWISTTNVSNSERKLTEAEELAEQLRKGKGIDWAKSRPEDIDRFLKMIVAAGNNSAVMRNLLKDIVSEQKELRYIAADLQTNRTGQHLVDSFTNDTINLGDLDFFPETPDAQTPWEMTRGEHIMHVLAERRALAKDSDLPDVAFQFNDKLRKAKGQRFALYHKAATEQHNTYRAEQGQPRQVSENSKDPSRPVLEYEGGKKQILELDEKGRPLKKGF